MDLQQIQYVVEIAESESMTVAASKLFISQSALSLSYKKLEKELGVQLFCKQGRTLELTDAGRVFYQKAKAVLAAVNELHLAMDDIVAEQKKTVLICTEAVDYTNEAVKIYGRRKPEVFFQQVRGSTEEIAAMLASGAADFAITLSPSFGTHTEAELLLEEPMQALVPADRPYAHQENISLAEMSGERIITLRKGLAINQLFCSYFRQAGLPFGRTLEVNDPETIVIQVSNGFGVSFIPKSTANMNTKRGEPTTAGTVSIPLTDDICMRSIYLVTVKGRKLSKSTQSFIDFLRQFGRYTAENQCMPSYENSDELGIV